MLSFWRPSGAMVVKIGVGLYVLLWLLRGFNILQEENPWQPFTKEVQGIAKKLGKLTALLFLWANFLVCMHDKTPLEERKVHTYISSGLLGFIFPTPCFVIYHILFTTHDGREMLALLDNRNNETFVQFISFIVGCFTSGLFSWPGQPERTYIKYLLSHPRDIFLPLRKGLVFDDEDMNAELRPSRHDKSQ